MNRYILLPILKEEADLIKSEAEKQLSYSSKNFHFKYNRKASNLVIAPLHPENPWNELEFSEIVAFMAFHSLHTFDAPLEYRSGFYNLDYEKFKWGISGVNILKLHESELLLDEKQFTTLSISAAKSGLPQTTYSFTRSRRFGEEGQLIVTPPASIWDKNQFVLLIEFLRSHNLGVNNKLLVPEDYENYKLGVFPLTPCNRVSIDYGCRYVPKSKSKSINSLVSPKLKDAIDLALNALESKVGDFNEFVCRELDYSPQFLAECFSAEQIDALALAIANLKQGKGFILGDVTGLGKGRVVAGIIRYALINGRLPIFVSDNEKLYADILRDLSDIGMSSFNPFPTNSSIKIPLPNGDILESDPHHEERLANNDLSGYDAIFSTYYQLSSINGSLTNRHKFLQHFVPGAIICFDESHQAGISVDPKQCSSRGLFAKSLAEMAHGVLYSSATFAKNPDALLFYTRTDILDAFDGKLDEFIAEIKSRGLALQQVVSTSLAKAGQYIRRERSFEGVEFTPEIIPIDKKFYNKFCQIMADILIFDQHKQDYVDILDDSLREDGRMLLEDKSVGQAGADSINFVAIMHNLVDQMLLSAKCESAVQSVLESIKNNQKPVVALANTMGSAIGRYVEDNQIVNGEPIFVNFGDLLRHYLHRSREVLVRDGKGKVDRMFLSDFDLPDEAIEIYEKILKQIEETDFTNIPVSPIDYIRYRLNQHGLKVAEITGRQHTIFYQSDKAIYRVRSQAERSKRQAIEHVKMFNNGEIDVLLINRSGSTGISLHASETFQDRRQRHLIILQSEKNENDFIQSLGRVNRTGQVCLPKYSLLVADIPAEKRPATLLYKKICSLNANTTGRKDSPGINLLEDTVDFINAYGDAVAQSLMMELPDINRRLGNPLKNSSSSGTISKVTGRIVFLPIEQQDWLYRILSERYKEYVELMKTLGDANLEAELIDGQVISYPEAITEKCASNIFHSPFGESVYLQNIKIRHIFKPHSLEKILEYMGVQNIADAVAKGKQESQELLNWLKFCVENYPECQDLSDAKQESFNRRIQVIGSIINDFYVGRTIQLRGHDGMFYSGVVGQLIPPLDCSDNRLNPSALSNWRIKVFLTSLHRQLILPFSQVIYCEKTEASLLQVVDDPTIWTLFTTSSSIMEQERQICTGNLLKACSYLKGKIVEFENLQGRLEYGLLLPYKYDAKTEIQKRPVYFKNVESAMKFMGEATKYQASLYTPDMNLRIKIGKDWAYDSSDYRLILEAPRSKQKGGRYYLNQKLLSIIQTDFFSIRRSMKASVEMKRAEETLKYLIDTGLLAITHIEKAQKIQQ